MGDEVIGKGNDGKIVSGVQHFHQLDGGVAGCLKGIALHGPGGIDDQGQVQVLILTLFLFDFRCFHSTGQVAHRASAMVAQGPVLFDG